MNENIDLTKILKDCPKGTKFYSPIFGVVDFKEICGDKYPIITKSGIYNPAFTEKGFYYDDVDGECLLFPSKDQRDGSKFTATWYKKEKKEKFDHKILKALDEVLVKDVPGHHWNIGIFSHYIKGDTFPFKCVGNNYKLCIPYNEDTKHLVGTTEEAPEYYKYWED